MDEVDDSVSDSNPSTALFSNPQEFLNPDDLSLGNMNNIFAVADDSNEIENQGDHVPRLYNLDLEGTSTSIIDREWGWLNDYNIDNMPQRQPGKINFSSSDCWSAASEALSLTNLLPAAAASGGENGNVAAMINNDQELDNLQEMKYSLKHLPSCSKHLLSLESDGEDVMSFESNGDEILSESTANLNEETPNVDSRTPEVGMVFSSEEEAYNFYETYAKEVGFRMRKGKVRRLSDGTIRKRFFYCSREGFRVKKQSVETTKYQRKETRTGCGAMVQFTVENGKWVISDFNLKHNHVLEGKSKLIVGSPTNISEDHSISTAKNKVGMVTEAEAANSVGLHSMDCSSFSLDEKTSCPQLVDGQSLINYFRYLQVEDPSFFYTVQVNAKNCLTSFFWTDGRSKIDYDYFGDVLILDTQFRIDAYNMIYAPFLGINHHGQYVLFGGSFVLDNSKDSFIWLFRTFLEAMGRRQPKTILTDEYQAMEDAIKVVCPKTQHLLGIWYILQNAKKHLSNCYGQPDFDSLFQKCIFACESEEEFESMWESLLEQYDLGENPWLKTLYMLRRKWSHCFCHNIFCAGIQSIQGSHSISPVFHSLVSKTMNPLQFVQQYTKVAEKQRQDELDEDFCCNGSAPETCLRSNAIEKEAVKIYTRTMFKLFQEELLGCLSVAIEEIPGDGMIAKFRLTEIGQKDKIVEFNHFDSRVTCSCSKYESLGILCVHALKVLNTRNIFHIPPWYILKRWTKSAKHGMEVDGEVIGDSQMHLCLHKSKLMHKALNVITKSLAVDETRMIVDAHLNMALKKVEDVLRTENIGHLNIRDVDVHYKDDAADANGNSEEIRQIESNPSRVNQQEASNDRTKSQLKRKHVNQVRETKGKSSDCAITHDNCFKEVTKGGDDRGSRRGPSRSYTMGENSRQCASISPRPPLPSQSMCNQFKDPVKSTGNMQLATQVRMGEMEKEILKLRHDCLIQKKKLRCECDSQRMSKLYISMREDTTRLYELIKKKLASLENLARQHQLPAVRGDNAKVSVTDKSLPEQKPEQN